MVDKTKKVVLPRVNDCDLPKGVNVQILIRVRFTFFVKIVFLPFCSPSWSEMPSLARKRAHAAAVVLGGDQQLLVTGGLRDGSFVHSLSSVKILNLQRQQSSEWIAVAPMRDGRWCHGMCLFRGG